MCVFEVLQYNVVFLTKTKQFSRWTSHHVMLVELNALSVVLSDTDITSVSNENLHQRQDSTAKRPSQSWLQLISLILLFFSDVLQSLTGKEQSKYEKERMERREDETCRWHDRPWNSMCFCCWWSYGFGSASSPVSKVSRTNNNQSSNIVNLLWSISWLCFLQATCSQDSKPMCLSTRIQEAKQQLISFAIRLIQFIHSVTDR